VDTSQIPRPLIMHVRTVLSELHEIPDVELRGLIAYAWACVQGHGSTYNPPAAVTSLVRKLDFQDPTGCLDLSVAHIVAEWSQLNEV